MKKNKFDEVVRTLLETENKSEKNDKKVEKKKKVKTLSLTTDNSGGNYIDKISAIINTVNLNSSAYFSKKAVKERNKADRKFQKELAKVKVY